MPSLGHQRENDVFFFLTHSFPAFPPVLFGLCRAEVSRGREVRDRTGFGSIVTWFWRSLNRVDVPLLDYFLREHLRVVGGGRPLFRDSTLAGVSYTWSYLEVGNGSPCWSTVDQRKAPLLLSDSFRCRTSVWFSWADSFSRRSGLASFSQSTPGPRKMHLHPCPIRLSKYNHSHSHYIMSLPASCQLPITHRGCSATASHL